MPTKKAPAVGECGFGRAVDALYKDSGSSAARMPEVSNEEEEGQPELGGGQRLVGIDEVHRVGFSDDAANEIEGGQDGRHGCIRPRAAPTRRSETCS